jgi:hypothetical protein
MTGRRRGRARLLAGAALAATVIAALAGCAPAGDRPQFWSPYGPPGFRQPGAPLPFVPSQGPEPPPEVEGETDPSQGRVDLVDPDVLVTHTFVLSDGTAVTCTLQLAAAPDGVVDDGGAAAGLATEALRTTDWGTVISAPSELPPFTPEQASAGQSEAYLRSDEALRRIVTELFDRVDTGGFSVMGQSSCG